MRSPLLQFKWFEFVWGAFSVLRPNHTFSLFLRSNWSGLGHAETGSGVKKRVVLRREFFELGYSFRVRNGVWTKIRFLDSDFSFRRPIWHWFLLFFFFNFCITYFLYGFPMHSFSVLCPVFFIEWKVVTCPAMFLLIRFSFWSCFSFFFLALESNWLHTKLEHFLTLKSILKVLSVSIFSFFLFCFNIDVHPARQRWLFYGNLLAMFRIKFGNSQIFCNRLSCIITFKWSINWISAIFRLTDFSSITFNFPSSKTG